MNKKRKVLILTSSGGGGLLQAAVAQEQSEILKNPEVVIIKRDVVLDWYIRWIGWLGVRLYNYAQYKGSVLTLERMFSLFSVGEYLFWPIIFFRALRLIFRENLDRIIDTQPLGTSAVLLVLRIYHRLRKKKIILEKIIVDLPTEKNTHFFCPIKKLSKKSREYLRVVTIPPIVKQGSIDDFWRTNCNLSESQIDYEFYPIRQSFLKMQENRFILVEFADSEERETFSLVVKKGTLNVEFCAKNAKVFIGANDIVFTIMLGSQPALAATIGYIEQILRLALEQPKFFIQLFVFCGRQKNILRQIANVVQQFTNYPSSLTIIPMGFQRDETIAQIFRRSDFSCTRSGGQTAMELMCVMQGEILIHSETNAASGKNLSLDRLLQGIPRWEVGNAVYMINSRNAKIVTPETFVPYVRQFLRNQHGHATEN